MAECIEARCAVVQLSDGLVANIIVAMPSEPAQDGCQLIEVMNGQTCDIGWLWDGAQFVDPNPPAVELV